MCIPPFAPNRWTGWVSTGSGCSGSSGCQWCAAAAGLAAEWMLLQGSAISVSAPRCPAAPPAPPALSVAALRWSPRCQPCLTVFTPSRGSTLRRSFALPSNGARTRNGQDFDTGRDSTPLSGILGCISRFRQGRTPRGLLHATRRLWASPGPVWMEHSNHFHSFLRFWSKSALRVCHLLPSQPTERSSRFHCTATSKH